MSSSEYKEGLSDLIKENQVLSENLSKCIEEKNFVWSLWKKLQTEKPDLSSVVSLVMAREKEKNEVRDAKVLNILEAKDEQIKQLEREKEDIGDQFKQKKDDLEAYSLRLHDLLIEKADLQERLETAKNTFEEKTKGLVEENGYLSEVVRARQIQLESDEDVFKTQLNEVDREKQELHKVVKDLELRLDKLNEDRYVNSGLLEENNELKDQLKIIQDQLMVILEEHEDGVTTLRLRESQLQKHSKLIQEHKELLNEKERLVVALRNELNEVKLTHRQCAEYANEQSSLIENLQSLQEQTQIVVKAQEEKYKAEIIALKEHLSCEEERSREIMEANVQQSMQECNKCMLLEQELQTVTGHNEKLMETTQQKNRRISSLEKTLVSKGDKQTGNSSYTKTLERKCKTTEQKLYELQKVLELKENELDSLNSAHSNRHQRYKNLQLEHKIVLEQLKTYESLSDDERKKREIDLPISRASPRSLQRENSDSVWNELQHFKKEYENLQSERDSVMEEIDILRVEHVNDITTIHELRTCLEDEKRDLMEEMKLNNAQEKDEIKKEVKRLEKGKNAVEKQMETLRKDFDTTEKKKESLEGRLEERDLLVGRLEEEVLKYKKELNTMKNEKKKMNEENGKMTTRNDVSFDKKGKHSGATLSDKQVQTDLTYEEQLREATKKIILDMTRDNVISNHHDVTHRNTQTSPRRTMGEPSNYGNVASTSDTDDPTMVDDSVLSRNESVSVRSKNVKKTGDKEAVGTPSKRSRTKTKSPIHREWKTMRQRVLSLTQQVAALKASKESLTKSTTEQQSANEKLQNDLTQCQQRLKLSKQTVERLTKELEECSKQKQAFAKTSKDYKIPSYPTEKHLEERLKLSANECSRLSYELKCARKTNEELQEKLTSCQERNTRQEHLVNQKKCFVEEMRSRLKVAQENFESTADELKQAKAKTRRITEKENQRKNQIDSLKRQLELEVKNRQTFERLHEKNQEDLKRKAKLLSRAQTLRQEAETAVNEMEEAANAELHNLANQSEVTLSAIEGRLTKSKQRIDEFKIVVITLTERLIEQFVNSKMAIRQETSKRLGEQKQKPSMRQACELASSILNMSKADIDELLDVDIFEDEESFHCSDEEEWKKKVEETLAKEESFAAPLVQIFLEMIQGIVGLEKRNTEEHPTIS